VTVDVDLRNIFDVLVNDADLSTAYPPAAAEIVGAEKVSETKEVMTGSEDFADMLKAVPGAYCTLGHKGGVPVHNPAFVLDEEILPVGASIMARIIERRLPLTPA
jgi:hippurate hydrolase